MRNPFATKALGENGRPAKNLRAARQPKCLPARFRLEELEARWVPAFDFTFTGTIGPGITNGPLDFAMGDISGDGLDDFVFTESLGNNLSHIGLRLGDGRGNFSALTDLDSPDAKGGIRLGDVNRDGRLDLVYTGLLDGTLRTRFGNGDGTFGAESVRGQLAPVISPASLLFNLELADINGDGTLDAVGGAMNAGVRILYDDGTGTFTNGEFFYDGAGGVTDMAVLDVTNDGAPDVVFTTREGIDLGVVSGLRSVVAIDGLNFLGGLDAHTRLACATLNGAVVFAVTENPEGANVVGRVVVGRNPVAPTDVLAFMPSGVDIETPALADFDGDGILDLAYAERLTPSDPSGTLRIRPGRPTGAPVDVTTSTTYLNGWTCNGVFPAQMNADGTTDILVRQLGHNGQFYNWSIWQNNQQSLVVSTTADENDGNARWNSGTGTSLREALAYAQTRPGATTVTFAPFLGLANSTVSLNSPIALESNGGFDTITVRNDFGSVALSGRGQNRVLAVGQGVSIALENLTITGGLVGGGRGAVSVALGGALAVTGCTFTGNDSGGGDGAALSAVWPFSLTVRNSTFAGNTGGAAVRVDERPFTLLNSTVSGNAAGVRYTGTYAGSDLVLSNNIIAGNAGTDLAVAVAGGSVGGSNNVVRTGTTAGLTGTINADPLLNPLANNGGRTPTMSLQSASPALDAAATLANVPADQRGVARPQFGAPDIGAFEARLSDLNLPSVTTPDGASWFLFSNAGADRRVYRQAPGQAAAWVDGGTASFLALQYDGSVVVRNAGGGVYVRTGSAGGIGTGWDQRPTAVAADGATWLLGSDGTGADRTIYRWDDNNPFSGTGGQGVRLGSAGGTIVAQTSNGEVHLRAGSAGGLGTAWSPVNRATAGDGATWFVGAASGADGGIYRWASSASPVYTDGSCRELTTLSGGSIVARTSGGNVYGRPGSNAGLGTGWSLLPREVSGDGATWFLGMEDTGPNRTIYRWASGGSATNSNGGGVTLGRLDGGSIVVRVSGGNIYGRPGSNAGLGASWELLNRVTAGDGAAWFASVEFAGLNRTIYRWTGTGTPQFTDGYGLTLSVTPAGVVRTTNAALETYQRIGSASGLGSAWLRLTESLVVTTAADENDFTSSANLGTGTSLREALRYAEGHPGADTITFAAALAGQTVRLGTGWNDADDASALRVSSAVTLQGLATAPGVTIGMAPGVPKRHLTVEDTRSLTVSHLTFTNGFAADFGGSIWNFGSLTVRNSTFTGNHAGTEGGAIQSWGGSTLLHVENSTFAGNSSGGVASAIATGAASNTWDHVTIVDNTAAAGGGSTLVYQTTVTLRNSIIARNTNDGTLANGTGTGTFAGSTNNLLGDGDWPGLTNGTAGNRLGVTAAQLDAGTLADNGGPTRTVALMPGSYAVNAGTTLANLPFDQRGDGFLREFGPTADIGAFELQSIPPPAPRVAGVAVNAGQSNTEQRSRVTSLTVTFDAAVTFAGAVADAFTVSRIGGASVGGFTATSEVVNGVTVVTLTGFTGDETEFGSLADGRFSVLVRADQVSVGGVRLDGDGNGLGGDDYTLNGTVANGLYRLFGDVDGNGTVNAADYGAFRPAYGSATGQSTYLDWLDVDGDGVINAFDYGRFRNRYGASVP